MKYLKQYLWAAAGLLVLGCGAGSGEVERPAPRGPDPSGAERRAEPASSVRIGVIVPRSGSLYLERYGDLVLEGVELAVAEYATGRGLAVELEVVDDGGDVERAAAAVRSLERMGAVAIIGPLLPAEFEAVARARSDDRIVVISPTAGDAPSASNLYALNAGDVLGAEMLARYAVSEGLRRVALLYPRTAEHSGQAAAFKSVLEAMGGEVAIEIAYDSGTTTFAKEMQSIRASRPQALFVPTTERDVNQIAPQITYYGVAGAGVQILGGEAWTSGEVRNQVAERYLEGVVAVTPLVQSSDEVGWRDFERRYEERYRRSLGHPFPALGYDAAGLVLAALEAGGRGSADDVAGRVAGIREHRGATGVLSVRDGRVVRRPFLVRIEGRELVPIAEPR